MPPAADPPGTPSRRPRAHAWARRLSLAGSWLVVLGVPLWHLRAAGAESGLSTAGSWYRLAASLPLAGAPPITGAPWTVRLFGLELLDPLAGLGIALSRGAGLQVLLGVLPTLLLVALLGRFFCGWLCPYRTFLAASNALRALLAGRGVRLPDRPLPRRLAFAVLAGVLAVAALAGTQLAPLLYPPAVLGRAAVRAVVLGGLGLGALLVLGAFLLDTFVARAGFCRHLCPGGALMTLLGALSPLRVLRDATRCTDCGACDQACNLLQRPATGAVGAGCERCGLCIEACAPGALRFALGRPAAARLAPPTVPERRALLGAVPAFAALALLGRPARSPARLRPPRAAPGGQFSARCIRCQRCAEVCPPKAIRFDALLDLRSSETPYLEPRLSACTLCMRCTEACPTGALLPTRADLPALQSLVRMGRPVLNRNLCLPWTRDGICRLCYYACPYPDSAITLSGPGQAPDFHADRCVGCGRCEEACPDRARAIRIEPSEES